MDKFSQTPTIKSAVTYIVDEEGNEREVVLKKETEIENLPLDEEAAKED